MYLLDGGRVAVVEVAVTVLADGVVAVRGRRSVFAVPAVVRGRTEHVQHLSPGTSINLGAL